MRSPILVGAALFLTVLGFLPFASWIPGGYATPDTSATYSDWLTGSLIVAGGGLVAAILSRSVPSLWRSGATAGIAELYERRPVVFALLASAASFALNVVVAHAVFDGRPMIVDEIAQLVQAQIYTTGRLSAPTPALPEFFSLPLFVDGPPKMYAQFPPGGPAMLAAGELAGAAWMSTPLWGALSVGAWVAFLRAAEPRAGVAVGATMLFALSPFAFFLAGSHMNHTATLMWSLAGSAALVHVMRASAPHPWLALASGLAFGAAATIRPTDALAFAAPAGVWYLWRAVHDRRRWADALAAGVGVAIPVMALMLVNLETTGAPLRFGYQVVWGPEHDPGFHVTPSGEMHTPMRGLELVSLYLWRMQKYLFETPVPSLAPVVASFLLARKTDAADRYLLAASALVVVVYWAYWFDASYLGPRFFLPLAPLFALWAARLPALLRERGWTGLPYRATVYGAAIAGALAVAVNVPIQWRYYATNWATMRYDVDAASERAGVRGALVLVRESWGTQLVSRMRALGVPAGKTGMLLRHIDSCVLEEVVSALEDANVRGAQAVERLLPLQKDSARLIPSPYSPLTTEMVLPGTAYSARCASRITDDQAGFTQLMPLRTARGGNVYARDLHGRDSLLVRQYPERPVHLLRPITGEPGAPVRFFPVRMDSAWAAWRRR